MFKLLVYYFDGYQNKEEKKSNVTERCSRQKILPTLVSTEGVFGRHPTINFTTKQQQQ